MDDAILNGPAFIKRLSEVGVVDAFALLDILKAEEQVSILRRMLAQLVFILSQKEILKRGQIVALFEAGFQTKGNVVCSRCFRQMKMQFASGEFVHLQCVCGAQAKVDMASFLTEKRDD